MDDVRVQKESVVEHGPADEKGADADDWCEAAATALTAGSLSALCIRPTSLRDNTVNLQARKGYATASQAPGRKVQLGMGKQADTHLPGSHMAHIHVQMLGQACHRAEQPSV